MKYYLKLKMEGDFPSGADWESIEITSEEYNYFFDKYFRNRITKEDVALMEHLAKKPSIYSPGCKRP